MDGHYLEGFWRAHQIPLPDVLTDPAHLKLLEKWLRSYEPEKLFDQAGRLIPELRALAPQGTRRMSANPVAGFTHQDPGFLDVVANKSPSVVRIYLPPDANCLLSVGDHCFRSENYINVIVADKQPQDLQYLDMEAAIAHCTKGLGIWNWASNDQGAEPDVVMASCGDIPTLESLAATVLLRELIPDVKIRFVNVVDLFKLLPSTEHPHGLTDCDFEAVFTPNKPVIFNFHAYPGLIHRLTYRRPSQHNLHVRGYKEQGNINTPLELAIRNQTDRFTLAIDAIDRIPRLRVTAAGVRQELADQQIACEHFAYEHGIDRPDIAEWKYPHPQA